MISKREFTKLLGFGAIGAGVALLPLAQATTALAAKAEVFTGLKSGYGAGGYDVVSYFTANKPVVGQAKYETSWNGAKWAFSSQENLDTFKANPAKYAPQFGGYCAYAVSKGATAKGDPEAWTVYKGKLYLNFSKSVRSRWASDRDGNISRATTNWPKVLN